MVLVHLAIVFIALWLILYFCLSSFYTICLKNAYMHFSLLKKCFIVIKIQISKFLNPTLVYHVFPCIRQPKIYHLHILLKAIENILLRTRTHSNKKGMHITLSSNPLLIQQSCNQTLSSENNKKVKASPISYRIYFQCVGTISMSLDLHFWLHVNRPCW